jgi:glutamine---fructose-6-phosphate transaminase (isomerizing)
MMPNKLWLDIQAQADNLLHVVAHLYGAERPRLEAAAAFLGPDRPIVMIGVASAEYTCMPAEHYLTAHGRLARTMCASDALYTHLPALRGAGVVINSRSGETIEVVRLARALRDAGIPFLALTNEPASTLAGLADCILWADTRKDDLVSINVVTGMMTATLLLAVALCGELEALRPAFESLPARMGEVVAQAVRRSPELEDLLGGVRPIYLLYRGHSQGSANCGRLVLEEVARTSAIAMEAAEFRQGPNEVIDGRFGAVVFVPSSPQGELNRALSADILRCGGRVLSVGEVEDRSTGPNHLAFAIPGLPDCLRPVLEVVPLQLLAYRLAQAQGYEPGVTRYITKVILTEEGIPNQV